MSIRLETERLLLRPPEESDIPSMVVLLGDYEVAKNMASIPYPLSFEAAGQLVRHALLDRAAARGFGYTILRKAGAVAMGGISLKKAGQGAFTLSYWLGRPYWGQGYASEAAKRVSLFAFDEAGATSLNAAYIADNPASGRVLTKLGATRQARPMISHDCLARGHTVYCHQMALERADFRRGRKGKYAA